jgi:CheY-like chemotaxis protein
MPLEDAMPTVLVIEDEFLVGYELEHRLKALGYDVKLAGTEASAVELFRKLHKQGALAAVMCDNRLINGAPAAASVYTQVRAASASTPFIVYSGFPPEDFPTDDPHLVVVRKPRIDDAIDVVSRLFAPSRGKGPVPRRAPSGREAA